MKKIFIVFPVLLCIFFAYTMVNMAQNEDVTLEGRVVEKYDYSVLVDAKIDANNKCLIDIGYPDKFDVSYIAVGDKIKVYYTGEILESYPCRINKAIKIEKIDQKTDAYIMSEPKQCEDLTMEMSETCQDIYKNLNTDKVTVDRLSVILNSHDSSDSYIPNGLKVEEIDDEFEPDYAYKGL